MSKKRRKRRPSSAADPAEGRYTCPTCGEEIVIPLDASAGPDQRYVEDCPVCCHPNLLHIEFDPDWPEPRVWAESE